MGTGWVTGAAGVGGVVAAAGAEAESDPGGGGGSVGGSGAAAGPEAEPGSGVSAGAGDGLVGGKGSPLGWSLVLYKGPSGQGLSDQRESCWGGHADELASPAPKESRKYMCLCLIPLKYCYTFLLH